MVINVMMQDNNMYNGNKCNDTQVAIVTIVINVMTHR